MWDVELNWLNMRWEVHQKHYNSDLHQHQKATAPHRHLNFSSFLVPTTPSQTAIMSSQKQIDPKKQQGMLLLLSLQTLRIRGSWCEPLNPELQHQYTNFKNTLQQLAQKIGDIEQEAEEHKWVIIRVMCCPSIVGIGGFTTSEHNQRCLNEDVQC